MLIPCKSLETALPDYYNHFLHKSKIGIIDIIAGGSFLKMGVGKSYAAMRKGELIDKDFHIGKVVYHPGEFLKAMHDVESDGTPGQVVVVDEGEITAPAALWYSVTNRMISYSLSTSRYLRSMTIFVTPSFGFLDRKVRVLASHINFCDKVVLRSGAQEVSLRTYRITTDLFGDKIFFGKIWMYNQAAKKVVKFNKFKVSLPSPELIEAYEKKSMDYKTTLRGGLLKEVERFEKYQQAKSSEEVRPKLKDLLGKVLKDKNVLNDLNDKGSVSIATICNSVADDNLSQFESARLTKMAIQAWRGGN